MGRVKGKELLILWGVGGAFALFLAGGGLKSMGKGSTPTDASFSPSCEAPLGKWVTCSGTVMSIEKDKEDFRVEVRTHIGERISLSLNGWDTGLFKVDKQVEFKVKGVGESRYFSEVQEVTIQTLEKYCTPVRWKKSMFEPIELGRPVVIELGKYPELGREGIKYVYIRGSSSSPSGYEVVSVEQGEARGCMPGVNMIGDP